MHNSLYSGLLTGLSISTCATIATAGVGEFATGKDRLYVQLSATPPTAPFEYSFFSVIETDPGDATLARINGIPMPEVYPEEFELEESYTTQAALDAAWPAGAAINLHLEGGALGMTNEFFNLITPEAYPQPPAMTPATMLALQNVNPSEDLLLSWNGGGPNTNAVFVCVEGASGGTAGVCVDDFTGALTSLLIPAGTLSPNQLYEVELGFGNVNFFPGSPAPGGFGVGAGGISGLFAITQLVFQTEGAITSYCFGDGSGATCPCNLFGGTGEGCQNTGGTGATMTGSGATSFFNDTLQMDIVGVPGNKPGLILRGDAQVTIPAGDGILCTTGNTQRSHVQVTVAGSTTFFDFNGAPFGTISNFRAPTNFQFWYRDPTNPCSGSGFNFTNGVSVVYGP